MSTSLGRCNFSCLHRQFPPLYSLGEFPKLSFSKQGTSEGLGWGKGTAEIIWICSQLLQWRSFWSRWISDHYRVNPKSYFIKVPSWRCPTFWKDHWRYLSWDNSVEDATPCLGGNTILGGNMGDTADIVLPGEKELSAHRDWWKEKIGRKNAESLSDGTGFTVKARWLLPVIRRP